MDKFKFNIPTIFIIFGATGDLVEKKIVPSLFHLFKKGKLPSYFKAVGFARRSLSDTDFQEMLLAILQKHRGADIELCKDFCKFFSYQSGRFEDQDDYIQLAKSLKKIDDEWGICSNKIFYLAVPPQFYKTILQNLFYSGLTKPCSPQEGWSRILIEKPFGKDLITAQALDRFLSELFKEEQIYRIDHYLAKEMLQNILTFRFSNNLFENIWSNSAIEKVEIRLFEKIGVEHRGSFYDGVGALQDVGQNHMLQMLALVAMEHPISFKARYIRQKRAEALKTLIPLSLDEIKQTTFRAQYQSYRTIEGVNPDSNTETYFKIRAFLNFPRFAKVPIILESGKRLPEQVKEVEITLKHPLPCLCPKNSEHHTNKIIISLEPKEMITIQFWSKKPGLEFETEKRTFDFLLRDRSQGHQYIEEYEKLLLDAIAGDQTLFVSTEEVAAMWRFIDPIVRAWQKNTIPLNYYQPDTNQPILASSIINIYPTTPIKKLKKEFGIIGLGKMGSNLARRLMGQGWRVTGFDNNSLKGKELSAEGLETVSSLQEIVKKLPRPRIAWLMIPSGKAVDRAIFGKEGLLYWLKKGDVIVDGGNSFYKDSIARSRKLAKKGIHFVDVGVSGGPAGALKGPSLMIGGNRKVFEKLEPLFFDLARQNSYQFFEGAGAGHFVKMVHNGIEYGMMQAIAEGFNILKAARYNINLAKAADIYNHGSVIESRLINWLLQAFELHGENLENVSGAVGHTGEGQWTARTAKELKLKAKVIEEALKFRIQSQKNPSYAGKILSALREQFGGHSVL